MVLSLSFFMPPPCARLRFVLCFVFCFLFSRDKMRRKQIGVVKIAGLEKAPAASSCGTRAGSLQSHRERVDCVEPVPNLNFVHGLEQEAGVLGVQ